MTEQESSGDRQAFKLSDVDPILLKGVWKSTLCKLLAFEESLIAQGEDGLLTWLRDNSQNGVNSLAKKIGLSNKTLGKFYDQLGIPRPTLTEVNKTIWGNRWQDPEFVQRHAEWSRSSMLERRQDESFMRRLTASVQNKWTDPAFRQKMSDLLRGSRQDPNFVERMKAALLEARKNTDWNEKVAESLRQTRRDPEKIGRFKLPTIQGLRKDIGYYAFSAWEANIARALMASGREFYTKQVFELSVPEEYNDVFPLMKTELTVDFITFDPRGNLIAYEIMAHPREDPIGFIKLELLAEQYPNLIVRPINPKFYSRIQRHFEERINDDSRFCGWETFGDNLRTNPEKFSNL